MSIARIVIGALIAVVIIGAMNKSDSRPRTNDLSGRRVSIFVSDDANAGMST